jgi:glycosyltransferase involved in cell wall biosynthesis
VRVLICTPTAYLQGGVERILESLATHLPSRDIEVMFALAKGVRFHDPDAFRAAFPSIRGIDVFAPSGTSYGRRTALRRVIETVDPDLVLIARMFEAYPVCSALKRDGHRLRLAVTVQAYETDYFVDLARYESFVDLCVTSGELIASAARQFTNLPASTIRSIPGGVAQPRVARTPRPAGLRIGYVGRLEQTQKRVLDLIAFTDGLRRRGVPFTLEIAGDGTASAELRERLPDAHFHGWVSTDTLYERVYPALDVLVHFAEWEGLTIAPREAMAHGVVPVVSRFAGAEDFVEGKTALTFPVGDVAAAIEAVVRLHEDRGLLDRLSENARHSQEGVRSEQGAVDAWAEAFRETVQAPQRVGASVPPLGRDDGLLTRLHIPEPLTELVRRVRRRPHGDPGSEWPHWSGLGDRALEDEILRFAGRVRITDVQSGR